MTDQINKLETASKVKLETQVSVIYDKNGTEIKDGDIIYNEWDRDPYQQVKVIDGKFMFGKAGTTPEQEEGGWCEMLNERYRFDLYWEIVNSR